jgi:hypothetical protein
MAHSDQPGQYVADGSEEFVSSMLDAVAVNEEKALQKVQSEGTASAADTVMESSLAASYHKQQSRTDLAASYYEQQSRMECAQHAIADRPDAIAADLEERHKSEGEDSAYRNTTRLRKACNLCAKNRLKCTMLPTGICKHCTARGVVCQQQHEKKRGRPLNTADNITQLIKRRKRAPERTHSAKATGVVPTGTEATGIRDWPAPGSIPYMNEYAIQAGYLAGIQAGARAPQMRYDSNYPPYCYPAVPALPYEEVQRMTQSFGAGGYAMYAAFLQQATAHQFGYGHATPAVPYAAPNAAFILNKAAMGAAAKGIAAAGVLCPPPLLSPPLLPPPLLPPPHFPLPRLPPPLLPPPLLPPPHFPLPLLPPPHFSLPLLPPPLPPPPLPPLPPPPHFPPPHFPPPHFPPPQLPPPHSSAAAAAARPTVEVVEEAAAEAAVKGCEAQSSINLY